MKRDVLLMHQRSVFSTPPDFTILAKEHADFAEYVTYNTLGKAKLDFKDVNAQRALSSTLMKHFFNLDVQLPPGRLVPAVPQRLNYILWVQDLVEKVLNKKDSVVGVDIGTGASCVLALLAHRQCGWDFLATETDPEAFTQAVENVSRNNLQEHVKVLQADSLVGAVEKAEGEQVDFCVCNPPFFTSTEEADAKSKAEAQGRDLPTSDMGGTDSEKVWPHTGEVGFFEDVLLPDSLKLRDKVGIYTCMLGKNSSVKQILPTLQGKAKSCRVAEFHQGKTTRYAIAWTFRDLNLQKFPYSKVKQQKPATKIELALPPSQIPVVPRVQYVWKEMLSALNSIEVPFEIVNEGTNMCHLWVKAEKNTWTHLRRRRRAMERKRRLEEEYAKRVQQEMEERRRLEEGKQVATEGGGDEPASTEPSADSSPQPTADTDQDATAQLEAADSNKTPSEGETGGISSKETSETDGLVPAETTEAAGEELAESTRVSAISSAQPSIKEEVSQLTPEQDEGSSKASGSLNSDVAQSDCAVPSSLSSDQQSADVVLQEPGVADEDKAVEKGVQSAGCKRKQEEEGSAVEPPTKVLRKEEDTAGEAVAESKEGDEEGQAAGSKRAHEGDESEDEPPCKALRGEGDVKGEDGSENCRGENYNDMAADEGFADLDPEPETSPLLLSADVRVRRMHSDVVIHLTIRNGPTDQAHQLLQFLKNALWDI
ncbi:RNA N(6)-adenosine-methyltransferase mettl16 [Haemaphysalis longicornis]